MSENSKIEWTHALLALGVNRFVTLLAKRYPVAQIHPQFGVSGERLYVMSVQVSPSRVSTMLTCESITKHHVESPLLVLVSKSFAQAFGTLSVPIGRAIRAAKRHLTDSSTDLRAFFNRPLRTALLTRLAFMYSTDSRFGLRGVRAPFESTYAPFRADAHLHPRTTTPASRQTIVSTGIDIERRYWAPLLTSSTSLQTGRSERQIFVQIQTRLLGCDLQCAFGSNCHG